MKVLQQDQFLWYHYGKARQKGRTLATSIIKMFRYRLKASSVKLKIR